MAEHVSTPCSAVDILNALELLAPAALALENDRNNIGLIVGQPDLAVKRVLVALDATLPVIEEARARGCQLLITHHPLIYGGIDAIRWDCRVGEALAALCTARIGLIVAHTNFDLAAGGVNDALCAHLGIKDPLPLKPVGRLGTLPEAMDAQSLGAYVGAKLGVSPWLVAGKLPIRQVAVIGGAGGEYLADVRKAGAQALITGEIKHHEALEAIHLGLSVVMAGHYATEAPAAAALAEGLQKALNTVKYNDVVWMLSERTEDPFVWRVYEGGIR